MKKKGFSLVELMVVLIVISVIITAMVPMITKKLSSQAISVGKVQQIQSTTSDITTQCSDNSNFGSSCRLCTSQYCIDCGLESCESGKYLDNDKCECAQCSSKFGSNCIECNANECTKCANASYYIQNGRCSACPTGSYCDGISEYATCPGNGYYCDSSGIHQCSVKFSSACSTCTVDGCTKCNNYYYLSNGECKSCVLSACTQCTSTSYCTKCAGDWVLDTSTHKCTKTCASAITGCLYCSSATECTTCNGAYFLNTSNTCTACSVSNCIKCKNGQSASSPACDMCYGGYYLNSSGTCSACSDKFGANCATCTDSMCTSCNQNYHIEDATASSACVADGNKFNCSDSNFMQVGDICMTRKNMGDTSTLPIPSTVTVVEAGSGEYCYSASEKCCWTGGTANQSACDSENGGYSGCNRTVCNWTAAKEICDNFTYGGRTWRLPTKEEMKNLPYYYSTDLGTNGLMLCDHSSGYYSARCADGGGRCKGSYDGKCYPRSVWSGTLSGTLRAYHYTLYSGSWRGPNAGVLSYAFSVRCVSE